MPIHDVVTNPVMKCFSGMYYLLLKEKRQHQSCIGRIDEIRLCGSFASYSTFCQEYLIISEKFGILSLWDTTSADRNVIVSPIHLQNSSLSLCLKQIC